jgi:hypothetical protein
MTKTEVEIIIIEALTLMDYHAPPAERVSGQRDCKCDNCKARALLNSCIE